MTDKPITPETVRAALEAATPGPWAVEYKHGTTRLIAGGDCTMCDETYYPCVPDNDGDWHLIAMAPDIAAAYIAQAEEIERLRALLDEAATDIAGYVDQDYPEATRAQYPSIENKFRRDMALVWKIRATLAAIKENRDG